MTERTPAGPEPVDEARALLEWGHGFRSFVLHEEEPKHHGARRGGWNAARRSMSKKASKRC